MEYDYEFMWDYEISVHDDLDESMHTQYAELDENYARRESTNFQTLAYMHYACWHTRTRLWAHTYGVTDDTAHYESYISMKRAEPQPVLCQYEKWHTPTWQGTLSYPHKNKIALLRWRKFLESPTPDLSLL